MVINANFSDFEHSIYVLDITFYIRPVIVLGGVNLFSGQEPGQSAHHSSGDRSDHVIQCRRVFLFGLYLVEIFDAPVDSVMNLAGKPLYNGLSCGSIFPFDPADACVNKLSHLEPPYRATRFAAVSAHSFELPSDYVPLVKLEIQNLFLGEDKQREQDSFLVNAIRL